MNNSLTIDKEFSQLIPPLRAEEYQDLEASILEEGCRDALVVWPTTAYTNCKNCHDSASILEPAIVDGDWYCVCNLCGHGHFADGTLIDGHNRYKICQKHSIEFETTIKEFADREEAKIWILNNQLARRNLTVYQRGELSLRKADILRLRAKENQLSGLKQYQEDTVCMNSYKREKAVPVDIKSDLGKELGIGSETMSRIIKIDKVAPNETKEKLRSGEVSINRVYTDIKRKEKEQERQERRQQNLEMVKKSPDIESLTGKFSTIMIDPPWDWGDEGDVDQFGRAKPTYQTMSMTELLELPAGNFADVDCHLYLWITNRSLPKGFQLIERWGFRYITCLTWCKPSIGMGNYFRGSSEHILFAVKGSQGLKRHDMGTWFQAPRGKDGHSSKPQEIYDIIESCSPGPYLEVFARAEREGWFSWGAEVGNTI